MRLTRLPLERKTGLRALEDRADHQQADDHRQSADVTGAHAPQEGLQPPRRPSLWLQPLVSLVESHGGGWRAHVGSSLSWPDNTPDCLSTMSWRRSLRRVTTLSVAPVMAATTSEDDTVWASNSPLLRPSRRTTTRSATARTSSMLWLIMMTPSPRSRSRSIRSSTSAVWATPRAAVGSSRMMTRGSPSSDRAIATVCR